MHDDKAFIESLCDFEIPNTIKFRTNNDGQKLLYSTSLTWGHHKGPHAKSTIWLADTGVAKSARRITSGEFKDYAAAWTPDGRSVVFLSDRARAGRQWALYMASVPDDGGDAGLLEDDACALTCETNEATIEKFVVSPDGKQIAYLSADEVTAEQRRKRGNRGEDVHVWGKDWAYARLRVVDVATREVKTLDLERHVIDLCWSPDGKDIAFVSCETPDLESRFLKGVTISTVDTTDLNTVRDLCSLPRSDYTTIAWAQDDGRIYFCAGVPVDSQFAGHGIYVTDPEAHESSGYEYVGFGVDDDAVGLTQATNGDVLVKVEHRLESRICSLSGKVLYTRQQELEAFDAVSANSPSSNIILAVATSDVNNPVEVFTTPDHGTTTLQISDHGSSIKSRTTPTVCHTLTYPSGDPTIELDALYLYPSPTNPPPPSNKDSTPPPKPPHPLPTIILLHGGPNTRLTNAFNTYYFFWVPYLLSQNYSILIPNYRGSSGRGRHFASTSNGGTGVTDYEDVILSVQYAIDQGFADKNRLLVAGWSHGGFLTLACAVRNGFHGFDWRFKAAIAGAGICDSDAMALTSDLGCVFQPALHNGRVAWTSDPEDTRNRQAASPLWEVGNAVKISRREGKVVIPPMLILHGEEDRRCPVSQAWGMRRALEHWGLEFQMATYPRQGHFFTEQGFWVDMALRVGRWCERFIGDGAQVAGREKV